MNGEECFCGVEKILPKVDNLLAAHRPYCTLVEFLQVTDFCELQNDIEGAKVSEAAVVSDKSRSLPRP